KMPVRLGIPQYVTGIPEIIQNPVYATSVGLLLYGQQQFDRRAGRRHGVGAKDLWGRMKGWFQGNF
ncbi:MAG: cell division protein FtsA, partial [Gammaproteobacteria bacterium]